MRESPLTAENVTAVLHDCFYTDEEIARLDGQQPPGVVIVSGVTINIGLHPERLERNKRRIAEMVAELPLEFFDTSSGGLGGWTFLNLCVRKDGVQWGEHINCDELLALALAVGLAEYCVPHDWWPQLPGGVPYVCFKKDLPS